MFVYSLDGLEIDGDLPPDQEIEENELTARSGVYQTLARLVSLPDSDAHQAAVAGEWPARLREAGELLAFEVDFGVAALPGSVSEEDFQAEYIRLFDVGEGNGVPAPILGGAYQEGDRRKQLEEVVRFYEYFGLKTSAEDIRPPDHLATEFEFMCYLTFKEAASASPRLQKSFRRAQVDFLERQLAWLPEFARRTKEASRIPFYTWAAETAVRFLNADAQYVKQ